MIGEGATDIEEDIIVNQPPPRCRSVRTGVGTLLKEDHVEVGEAVGKVVWVVGSGTTITRRPHSPRAFIGVTGHRVTGITPSYAQLCSLVLR